jgi:hypothetical protein
VIMALCPVIANERVPSEKVIAKSDWVPAKWAARRVLLVARISTSIRISECSFREGWEG